MAKGPLEYQTIIASFKRALREKGIKYRDLAKSLGMSESGLKKIMAAQDGSYGRLAQIAQALELNLADVISESAKEDTKLAVITEEQQEVFLKNPELFDFFFKLVVERNTAAELKQYFKMSEAEYFKALRRMEDLKIIEILPGNRLKLPALLPVKNFGAGRFLAELYQKWSLRAVKDLARPELQADAKFVIRCVRMKESTYKEFLSRIDELDTEFLRRAIREMNVSLSATKPMRWISVTDQTSAVGE